MLYLGIADFAEPTLLLVGEANSLAWLAHQIETRRDIDFSKVPNVVPQPGFDLRVLPTAGDGSLMRKDKSFVWEISAQEASFFTLQLRELAASASPAHTYLDPHVNAAGVQIVASLGEYEPHRIFSL